MRIAITGSTGFVGTTLINEFPEIQSLLKPSSANITSNSLTKDNISIEKVDCIVHLAAQSNVAASLDHPYDTINTNVLGTLRILEILKEKKFTGRFLYVSSGDIYGKGNDPINEDSPPNLTNPYSVSKYTSEQLIKSLEDSFPFDTLIARPFNHIGPGQSPSFAISCWAKQVAQMMHGKREPVLTVGNISVERNFTDVRDTIRAYFKILETAQRGEVFNICSEKNIALNEVISFLKELSGIDFKVEQDPNLFRPNDYSTPPISNSKITKLGWTPRYQIDKTLGDILNYWEKKVND